MAGPLGRAAGAVISVMLAAVVALSMTFFTSGWAGPAGAALLVAVLVQACVEGWRAWTNEPARRQVNVRQRVRKITGSLRGVRGHAQGSDITIDQDVDEADRAEITGVDLSARQRPGPGRAGRQTGEPPP